MLAAFLRNPEISEFLTQYRPEHWKECIEAALVVGIRSLGKDLHPVDTLNSPAERPKAPSHKGKTASLGSFVVEGRGGGSPRVQRRVGRIQGNRREEGGMRTSGRTAGGKAVPRYLQSVESKIKRDVRKDIQQFWSRGEGRSPTNGSELRLDSLQTSQKSNADLKELRKPLESAVPAVKEVIQEEDSASFYNEDPQPLESDHEDVGDLMHIAEDFLRDPLMAQLSRRETMESSRDTPIEFSPPPQAQPWDSDPSLSPLRQSISTPDGLFASVGESYSMTPSSSISGRNQKLRIAQKLF